MSHESKVRHAFAMVRSMARRRGIDFQFTFEEWVDWWENNLGPDWFDKRGRRRNQYVMARKGDTGPYSEDNVECIFAGENVRRALPLRTPNLKPVKGEDHPRARLKTGDVIDIFYSKKSNKELVAKYGVNGGHITDIQKRRMWRHVTSKL